MVSVDIATTQGGAQPQITIMVAEAIETDATPMLTYNGDADEIKDRAGNDLADITSAVAVAEEDVDVTLTDSELPDLKFITGKRITPLALADGNGGNGTKTYTLTHQGHATIANDQAVNGETLLGLNFVDQHLIGTPGTVGTYTLRYTVTDDDAGSNMVSDASSTTESAWVEFDIEVTEDTPPPAIGAMGQITEFKLVGNVVVDKTIAGEERHHVPEGSQAVDLSVTVQWTHEEIAAIGYNVAQTIDVEIMSDRPAALPTWLSWIDTEGQDVHFPRTAGHTGTVTVRTPRRTEISDAQVDSPRHVKSKTGTLDVLILHDDHEAENDAFYIEATGGDVALGPDTRRAYAVRTLDVVIEDDEEQKVRIRNSKFSTGPTNLYEPAGDATIDSSPTFHVDAVPPRNDLPLEVRLDIDQGQTVSAAQISLGAATLMLNDADAGTGNRETVDVNLPDSDGNRMDDSYTLNASVNVYSVATGGYRTIPVAEHAITVLDRHRLPWLVDDELDPSTATVAEGGMVELEVTIHRNPSNTFVGPAAINSGDVEKRVYSDEEVTVMLSMGAGSTTSASDYSIMPASVTFPERTRGSYTATMMVEVEAMADDELDDMEMLVLDAAVAGGVTAHGSDSDTYMSVSTLTIEEGTTKLVYPKTDEEIQEVIYAAKEAGMGADMMFNPGEMIEIESAGALFNAAEGVTLSYSAMSDNDDVATVAVSGAMVAVTAEGLPGVMAHITITAHASMPAGAKGLPQDDPREASVIFPVEVGLAALSIELSQSDDMMNLAEGGVGGMVTATANRMVTADTKVTLMRDRSKSSADDMDFEADPITILAGQMSGSTMVMAVEDDMMEDMEELVLYGMTEGMEGEVTGEVMFYLWDAAVPALPIIGQLLLAAFLALGGYRRYRRR